MKKVLSLIFIFIVMANTFLTADDTYFFMSGGNLRPTTEKDTAIRMKEELIYITCESNYYQVDVDFYFENYGAEVNLSVGFPFFEVGIDGHGKIYDFCCWTNDQKTDFSDMPIERNFSVLEEDKPKLVNAYVRNITFAANSVTTTKISYKSEYGADTDGYIIKYLYGTGSTWVDTIGKITVIVENNIPYEYIFEKSDKYIRIADNKWKKEFFNVEPEYTDCFTFFTKSIVQDTGPKCFPSYFKYNRAYARPDDFYGYTSPQLRILRNTIYALHGYAFKSKDLQDYFNEVGRYWHPAYQVNPDFSEDAFSFVEEENIQVILKEENLRKTMKYPD